MISFEDTGLRDDYLLQSSQANFFRYSRLTTFSSEPFKYRTQSSIHPLQLDRCFQSKLMTHISIDTRITQTAHFLLLGEERLATIFVLIVAFI